MPKLATKASDNEFYKARLAASSCNDRLASREGASEETGIDRTRLARIELGSLNPYPEEVLLMADTYDAPQLANFYCSKMCPLGKKTVPPAEMRNIDRLTIRIITALGEANEIRDAILEVVKDGVVLLQAVIIAAVPVITSYLCSFLKQKSNQAAAKTNNELAASYIKEAADAVTTAVTFTSQTYVDNLKNSGAFSTENQKEAFNKAMSKAMEIMSAEAKNYLAKAYGDLTNYLATKIEAEVRDQKNTAILTGELITE